MFEKLNELKYDAVSGKSYIIYFLKFWKEKGKNADYVVKYQIRSTGKDFVWYGRISEQRIHDDLQLTSKDMKKMAKEELAQVIEKHVKAFFLYVFKKGLDKGFEDPNTEFVVYRNQPIAKRLWGK